MSPPLIAGIVLVKNENLFVRDAVANILSFCDRVILCDNGSTDGTAGILRSMAAENPSVEFHAIAHPRESHDLLQPFAGTRTWVFGVDGDEIYDPAGLAVFRSRLLGGEFDKLWRMKGHALHCERISAGQAFGYGSPPSRSITKLYNFAAISSWSGDTFERLHGGKITFREGWHDAIKRNLQDDMPWDACPLRCLHLCFMKRSSVDRHPAARRNIVEIHRSGWRGRLVHLAEGLLGKKSFSRWKTDQYRRGPQICVDATPFFKGPIPSAE